MARPRWQPGSEQRAEIDDLLALGISRSRVAARFQVDRGTLVRWQRDRSQDAEAASARVPDPPLPPPKLDPCEVARRVLLAMAAGKVPATGPRVAACRAVIDTAPKDVPERAPDTVADSWDSLLQ